VQTIAASLLAADFACLEQEVAKVANADYLHVDVMDGQFVPNISFGPPVIASIAKITPIPLHVHLMVEEPIRLLDSIFASGEGQIDCITVHAEACKHLHRTLQAIKDRGIKAGVALNPATSVTGLEHVTELLDRVLVMTVNPGFGGQQFLLEMVPKIKATHQLLSSLGVSKEIGVDGGIDLETGPLVVEAGASFLIAGSAIFGADEPDRVIEQLRSIVV